MSAVSGWPFLVARGRETGYQLLLAPDFVLAGRAAGLLLAEVSGEVPAQGPPQVSTLAGPSGPLAVVQRTVRASRGDVGEQERPEAPLLDRAGRPILLGFGFVTPGVQVTVVDDADLWPAQEAALATYRRFHADEHDFVPEASSAYPLRSTVGRPPAPAPVAAPPAAPAWSAEVLPTRPPEPPRPRLLLPALGVVALLLVVLGVFVFRGGGDGAVAVPDVVGLSQADAAQRLQKAGLTPVVTTVAMSNAAVGTVLATAPAADETVPAGSTVELTVSSGLAKSATNGSG